MWEETLENHFRENPHTQIQGTEKPIRIVPPVGFAPGIVEVEGNKRFHHATWPPQGQASMYIIPYR